MTMITVPLMVVEALIGLVSWVYVVATGGA